MYKKIFILIVFITLLSGCTNQNETISRIKYFSGVKMPAEAEILYSYITLRLVHKDMVSVSVFI